MTKTLTLKGVATGDTVVGDVSFEAADAVAGTSGTGVILDGLDGAVQPFTEEQLVAMLAKMRGESIEDATRALALKPLPPRPEGFQGIWDATSLLPVFAGPKAEVDPNAPFVPAPQLPPRRLGDHSMLAPQINVNENINPATGLPYAQVTSAPRGGMISPPPTRNFR